MAAAIIYQAFVYPAKSPLTAVTPSSTVGHHTTDGTDISIRATAHGLDEYMLVTLAGWAWATGDGVIDGTYIVKTRTDANNFTLTPTTCPTAASNPETVGTYQLAPHDPRGFRLYIPATYGARISLPCGWWSIKHSGFDAAGSASSAVLAYRHADSTSDVTLPDTGYTITTLAKQKCLNIDSGQDEIIEIRGQNRLILAASTGSIVAFVRPGRRGLIG